MIFNQFDEFGNYQWHYDITGHAMEELVNKIAGPNNVYRGMVSATGSAGTIASGDYMKQLYPSSFIAAVEALQCPTLLNNGFGAHRVEGIGDKHVPWIYNVANTDFIVAEDDNAIVNLARLFNEPEGKAYLVDVGVPEDLVENLDLLGLSSILNLLSAIKMAKYLELTENDIVVTMLTDSMELYESRLAELHDEMGPYSERQAAIDDARWLKSVTTDNMEELTYLGKKCVHNLKYYTWVEQQGKTFEEIQEMWYDRDFWTELQEQIPEVDAKIMEFNDLVGLL